MFEKFTDRARKLMALANQEAQRFNHEIVAPEHMLLAIVRDTQPSVAISVLKNLGVDPRKVRLEVEKTVYQPVDRIITKSTMEPDGFSLLASLGIFLLGLAIGLAPLILWFHRGH